MAKSSKGGKKGSKGGKGNPFGKQKPDDKSAKGGKY